MNCRRQELSKFNVLASLTCPYSIHAAFIPGVPCVRITSPLPAWCIKKSMHPKSPNVVWAFSFFSLVFSPFSIFLIRSSPIWGQIHADIISSKATPPLTATASGAFITVGRSVVASSPPAAASRNLQMAGDTIYPKPAGCCTLRFARLGVNWGSWFVRRLQNHSPNGFAAPLAHRLSPHTPY